MRLKNIAVVIITLATVLACQAGAPQDDTSHQATLLPTPDRSQVLTIDEAVPYGPTRKRSPPIARATPT